MNYLNANKEAAKSMRGFHNKAVIENVDPSFHRPRVSQTLHAMEGLLLSDHRLLNINRKVNDNDNTIIGVDANHIVSVVG